MHDPKGGLQPFRGVPEEGFEIPYRCLLPKKVENLPVAGRCVSATFEAQGSLRVMAACMAMGQAAGTAAAIAAKKGISPRKVDILKLRTTLIEQGAYI